MDEHGWLALCFIAFIGVAGKPIYRSLYSFLQNAQELIALKIKETEKVLSEASEKLDEANAMNKELPNSLKYILNKAQEGIDYELGIRTKNFEKSLELKHKQADNQIDQEVKNFKAAMLEILKERLHSKLINHFKNNKNLADRFTELQLKK